MCVNRPFDRNRWIGPISLASISSYSCPLLPSPTQLIIYSVHNLPSSYSLLYFTIFFWLFVSEPNLHCSYLSLSLSLSLSFSCCCKTTTEDEEDKEEEEELEKEKKKIQTTQLRELPQFLTVWGTVDIDFIMDPEMTVDTDLFFIYI